MTTPDETVVYADDQPVLIIERYTETGAPVPVEEQLDPDVAS